MKIKKFNEEINNIDISPDRISEIKTDIKTILELLDDKKEVLTALKTELSNFRSKSRKSNDQIDDTVANLEIAVSDFSDLSTLLDTVITNLKDYEENGRKYLY